MKVYILFTCHDGNDDGYVIAVYEHEQHAIEDMNKRLARDAKDKIFKSPMPMMNYYEVQSFNVI